MKSILIKPDAFLEETHVSVSFCMLYFPIWAQIEKNAVLISSRLPHLYINDEKS